MKSNLIFTCIAIVLFGFSYGQTVTFETEDGSTDQTICKGSVVQLNLDIDPPIPEGGGSTYNVQWEKTTNPTFITNCPVPDGTGNCTFFREIPQETTTYTVTVNGGPAGSIRRSVTITVEEIPNPGLSTSIFLCGKTGVIDLFAELDGGPQPGGTWSNGTGTYDTTNPSGGAFTYTISGSGVCPSVSATITVRPCADNDSDNDGITDNIDQDKDNDGIPNTVEDGFCTGTTLTPIFVLEEDFGFGTPTRSKYSEGLGLNYNPLLPQDIGNDGEYNVATSNHYRTMVGFDATFLATDQIGDVDANGDMDGRYLAINMKSSVFADKPVFVAKDLPVTPGILYNFSMSIASLNNNVSEMPANLTIEVVDQATGTAIFSQNSGEIANGTDQWILVESTFVPDPTVNVVSIRVINRQNVDGNGNDIGIDNVFLSTTACDFDRDGIPNSEDLDADNDGIYDIVETGNGGADANNDGRFDGPINANGGSDTVIYSIVNTDGDTQQNFLDIDSDNDGIVDNIEAQSTAGYIAPSGVDGDFNGVDDSYDTNGTAISPVNTNSSPEPDYIDSNSDPATGDCLLDTIEAYDIDQDGVADITITGIDTDNDGMDDAFDQIILDRLSGNTNANNGGTVPQDFPNNHNPLTEELDWREEIGDVDLGNLDIIECDLRNLYDELPVGTRTTGTWIVPTSGTALTGGHLGTMDPSAVGVLEGIYTYELPALAAGCSPIKYTMNITIADICTCPDVDEPVVAGTITTCINATPLPSVILTLSAGLEGRWYLADGTTAIARAQSTDTFTPTAAELVLGDNLFRVEAYDPVAMCTSDLVDVTITVTAAPEAGELSTLPAQPITACAGDTSSINLFDELTGEDIAGVWTDPMGVVVPNGTISANTNVAGDYTYTVRSNGCEDTAVVSFVIETNLDPGTNGNLNTCSSASAVNLFDSLGGTPDLGGSWMAPNGNAFGSNDQGTFDPANNEAGIYTYTVGTTSCSSFATVTVVVNAGANAGTNGSLSICNTDTTVNLFDSLGSNPDIGGSWTDPNGNPFGSDDRGVFDPSVSSASSGVYVYTVATATCTIPASAEVLVTLADTPIITVSGTICAADRASYSVSFTTNGAWEISVTPPSSETVDTVNSIISGIPIGTNISIIAQNPDNSSCAAMADVTSPDCTCPTVTAPTNPVGADICLGDPAPNLSVDVLTGQTANWYTSDGILVASNITSYTPQNNQEGTFVYEVEALDIAENCVSDRIQVTFRISVMQKINLIAEGGICVDENGIPIAAVGDLPRILTGLSETEFSFVWSYEGAEIAGETSNGITPQNPGDYTVTYTDLRSQCSISVSAKVESVRGPESLSLSLSEGAFAANNGIIANVVGAGTYEYSLDNGSFQASNRFENVSLGNHQVTVRDINSCGLLTESIDVFGFPNFFTPNNDGKNDSWNVLPDPSLPNMTIFIFDRYGKLLHQLDPNSGIGWDGTYNGIPMPATDYWFVARLADDSMTVRNHFTLKR